MLPELFRIPFIDFPVRSFGLMMVIGFLLALQLAKVLARRSGINGDIFVNAGMIALVAGVLGARASHVFENWDQYSNPARSFSANFWDAINPTSGGLTYYGGVLLATPLTIAYGVYKKLPIRLGMDIVAPCLLIGLGFGRVGCFLNGCCYGAVCDANQVPWAVEFPYHSHAYSDEFAANSLPHPPPDELLVDRGGSIALRNPETFRNEPQTRALAAAEHTHPRHPAQLYSTITALLLAGVLASLYTFPHIPGRIFALMLILEGGTRFLLELLRSEPAVSANISWSFSMVLSPILVAAGILMWFVVAIGRPQRFPPALAPA